MYNYIIFIYFMFNSFWNETPQFLVGIPLDEPSELAGINISRTKKFSNMPKTLSRFMSAFWHTPWSFR